MKKKIKKYIRKMNKWAKKAHKFLRKKPSKYPLNYYSILGIIFLATIGVFAITNHTPKRTIGRPQGIRWIDTQTAEIKGLQNQEIFKSDARSTHFKNDDGTITAYFTEFDQNAQDKDGNWQPIDYSLKKIRDKQYDYQTSFGTGVKISKKGAIENSLLQINSSDVEIGGFDFSSNPFTPEKYRLTSSKISDTTLKSKSRYFDFHIDITDQTIIQEIILKNKKFVENIDSEYIALKSTTTTPDLIILNQKRLPSGIHKIEKSDVFSIKNSEGKVITSFPYPQSWDKNKENIETLRYVNNLDFQNIEMYTLVKKSSLLASNLQFPITIDPDFTGDSADADIHSIAHTTYATARATSSSTSDTDVAMHVGQIYDTGGSANYWVERGYVKFDTSSIGSGSTIDQVNMDLAATTDRSEQDFNLRIHKYDWSGTDPITAGNMETPFDGCLSSTYDADWRNTSGMSLNTVYTSSNLDTTHPSKSGTTYYCLISERDVNGNTPSTNTSLNGEDVQIASQDNATAGYRPVLTIDYSVPYDSIYDKGEVNRTSITTTATTDEVSTRYQSLTADEHTIGLYHMNEGTDNTCAGGEDICDVSGKDFDGTFAGTAAFNGSGKSGEDSIVLDGNSDYIDISEGASYSTDKFSVEAWVYRDTDSGGIEYIVDNRDANDDGWVLAVHSTDEFICKYNSTLSTTTTTLNTGEWYHLGCTASDNTLATYVNGKLEDTITKTGSISETTNARIGAVNYSASGYFPGKIDEVRISDIDRTPEEIKASASRYPYATYTSPVIDAGEAVKSWQDLSWTETGVFTGDGETVYDSTNLVAQWNFNETSGTTANNDAEGTSCGGTPANCDGTLSGFDSTASQDADPNSSWTANNRRWGAGALQFDGTDSYAYCTDANCGGSSALEPTGDMTFEAWIKTGNSSARQSIIAKSTTNDSQYAFRTTSSGNLQLTLFQSGTDTTYVQATSNSIIADSEWHHAVSVLDDTNSVKIYIDGVQDGSSTGFSGTRDTNGSADVRIGSRVYSGNEDYFKGAIDTPKIYTRVLEENEIISLYNSSNIQFETRVGGTSTPDSSWEDWKPTTNSTQIEDFDDAHLYNTTDSGLVAYWPMDETADNSCSGGEDACDVKSTNHGTDSGGSLVVDGKFGKARGFDGTDDYLNIGSATELRPTTNITVSAWVKKPTSAGYQQIITSSTASSAYQLGFSGDVPYFALKAGGSWTGTPATATAPSTGTWRHIVGKYDGSNIKTFVDGVEYESVAATGVIGYASDTFHIGASGGVQVLDGSIDEMRIYNTALSDATIQQYFLEGSTNSDSLHPSSDTTTYMKSTGSEKITIGKPTIDSNTVAYWSLDETNGDNGGDDIFDATANNNDGEFNGTNIATGAVDGIIGKAREFNGSDDYLTIASPGLPTGNFTYEAWIKPDTTNDEKIYMATDGTGINELLISLESTDKLAIYTNNALRATSATSIKANKWTHVAITRSGSSIKMYINGVVDANTGSDGTALSFSTCSLLIGADADSSCVGTLGNWFDGSMDELRISNISKTAEEIAESYRMGRDHTIHKTITSIDLSDDNQVAFDIAADRPGTYLETIVGESAYANYLPDANTVGLWHMDEGTNNACDGGNSDACDSSGGGNHGNISSSPVIVSGVHGKGRYFDGNDDHIAISDSAELRLATTFTLDTWIKPTNQALELIIGKDQSYKLYIGSTSGLSLYNSDAPGWTYTDSGEITLSKWNHIATTSDGSTVKLYINGKEAYSTNYSTSFGSPTSNLKIGEDPSGTTQNFTGSIDEVRISNTARTAEEIRQAYEIGRRSHPITIDFAASLGSGDLIADSSDLSFDIDATTYGLPEKGSMLFEGDKIIVKENVDGVEYIAQGLVTKIQHSGGYTRVESWDTGSTFPTSGFTVDATVFKWQREYFDLSDITLDSHQNAITDLTFRVTNGHEGRTIYLDDLTSEGDMMTTDTGSTISSQTGNRYMQYRTIFSSGDEYVSATSSAMTLDYVTRSPDLYLKLDENYGSTAHDYSKNDLNGTIAGALWKTNADCNTGSCLYFDGIDDNINIPNNNSLDLGANSFTVTGWFKRADFSTAGENLISNYEATGSDGGYKIDIASDGDIGFKIADNNSMPEDTAATANAGYDDGTWHQFSAVKNGTTSIALYIDGLEVASDSSLTASGSLTNNDPVYIGIDGDGSGNAFEGNLDEIKVYRYARSAEEIKQDYISKAAKKGAVADFGTLQSQDTGPVGYWPMDENTGITTTYDRSGSGNDGTLSGNMTEDNWVKGKFGSALELDGSTDSVSITDSATLDFASSDNFTIEGWVKPQDSSSSKSTIDSDGFEDQDWSSDQSNTWTFTNVSGAHTRAIDTEFTSAGTYSAKFGNDDYAESTLALPVDTTDYGNITVSFHWNEGGIWEAGDLFEFAWTANGTDWNTEVSYNTPDGIGNVYESFDLSSEASNNSSFQIRFRIYNNTAGVGEDIGLDEIVISGDDQQNIISKADTTNGGYKLYLQSDGDACFAVDDDTTWTPDDSACTSGANYKDNSWHHFVGIKNGTSSIDLYVDGVLQASDTTIAATATLANSEALYLGVDSDGSSNPLRGSIDEVKVYDYARTPSQIIEDLNANHPIGGSPVASQVGYWSLDEQSGQTANDRGTGGNNGTLGASAASSTDDPTWKLNDSCKVNGCSNFDGADYVEIPDSDDLDIGSKLSITGWFNVNDTATSRAIVGKNSEYLIRFDSDDSFKFRLYDGVDWLPALTAPINPTPETWYHFAAIYDSTLGSNQQKIYLNGLLVAQQDRSITPTASANNLFIGSWTAGADHFDGELDEIKMYSTALTADEIKIDMNAGSSSTLGGVRGASEKSTLTDGAGSYPVGWWKFDENTGTTTTYDSSGSGNDLTLTSITEAAWKKGKKGSALEFDGSADYISMGTSSDFDLSTAVTMSTWVKTSSSSIGYLARRSGNADPTCPENVGGESDTYAAYFLIQMDTGVIRFSNRDDADVTLEDHDTTTTINDGNWHHVVAVLDKSGGDVQIYIDGKLNIDESTSETDTYTFDDGFLLGAHCNSAGTIANYYNGLMDDSKVYNYALTQSQIAYEYNRGKPIAWYRLDECTGTNAYDASGNAYHGTITIGATGTNTSAGTCTGSAGEAWKDGSTGKYNASLEFDGTDDIFTVSDTSNLRFDPATQDFSMALWVNIDSFSTTNTFIDKRDGNDDGYRFQSETDSTLTCSVDAVDISTTTTLDADTWHHIACIIDRDGNGTIYIDGILDGTGSSISSEAMATTSDIYFGRRGSSAANFVSGQMDDIRIYNYALSATQIKSIINYSAIRFE